MQGLERVRLIFRCPNELKDLLPVPVPAAEGLPGWLKSMPAEAFSALLGRNEDTAKRCPPLLDAMTTGFLMPLMCDVRVEDGEFSWDMELPAGRSVEFPRSPMSFHDPAQISGAPFAEQDQFIVKFHNPWAIEVPAGYSVLFTHPLNRHDLPFVTLTGLVNCDRFSHLGTHFPALWRDPKFKGVLPKGTPIAHCIPVKRESWDVEMATLDEAQSHDAQATLDAIRRARGVYRRRFQA